MGPTGASKPLFLWCSVQHHTCLQLPQRSISNNQAQSHPRLDSPASHWCVPKCWDWTTPSIPIRRNFPAPNHKLGRQCKTRCESPWILGKCEAMCVFDVRVFNSFAPSHANHLQKEWGGDEKAIWEENHWHWAWLFHTPSDVSDWRTWPLSWSTRDWPAWSAKSIYHHIARQWRWFGASLPFHL